MPLDAKSIIAINQLTTQIDTQINEVGMDYFLHYRIHFLITWNADNTKIIKIKRLAPQSVHINDVNAQMEPINFLYSWDWKNISKYPMIKYAAFDQSNKTDKEQIFMWQGHSPSKRIYVEPSYISALSWVVIDAEQALYHKSNIQQSLNPSMLIQFYEKPGTPEEKQVILNGINQSFSSAKNAGRAMVTFADGKDLAPTVTMMNPNMLDKTFLTLCDTIGRNLCYAHSIDPQLLGLKTPGSLGNSGELEYSYNIFNQSQIQPAQRVIEKIYNTFLAINGLGVKLKLEDVNIILPSEDGAAKFGDAPKVDEEEMSAEETTIVINENLKNLTPKQHQQMLRIMRQHNKGQLGYYQAALLLQSSLGLSDEQIEIILGTNTQS